MMKKILECIGGCLGVAAFGALGGWLFWLCMCQDDAELKAGKSPHSGFSPSCPAPKGFDGQDEPSRSPRTGEKQ